MIGGPLEEPAQIRPIRLQCSAAVAGMERRRSKRRLVEPAAGIITLKRTRRRAWRGTLAAISGMRAWRTVVNRWFRADAERSRSHPCGRSGDILMFGTGGIAIGAVLAEMHHIRRSSGPRTAPVQASGVSDYLLERDARWMIGVGAVAVAAPATGVWSADTRAATWWGLGSCAALGLARLAQYRVVTRARPAVSKNLSRADDIARELAIGRGLACPATFSALALVTRSFFALEPTIGNVARVLGVAAWITAFVLWWQNRRLGLDFLTSGQRDPVLA